MNPLVAYAMSLLPGLAAKGETLALEMIGIFMADVLAGKNVVDAANDMAMRLAEEQALALDNIVSPE